MSLKLRIYKETSTRVPRVRLASVCEEVVRATGKKTWRGRVNLIFTTDSRMRTLNYQFRQIDKTTDVLSFNIEKPLHEGTTLGEIYISVKVATRQASEYGASLSQEYVRLFTHGLLHLWGYDHKNKSEAEAMFGLESKIMKAVERS